MKKFLLSILCLVAVAMSGYAADATFDFAAHYGSATISGIDTKDPMTVDGITMTFAKGNSQTAPAYNKAGEIRLYGGSTSGNNFDGNTVTITAPAGSVITGVVFNPGTEGTWGVLTADLGSVSTATDNTATWSGNAETVVFTANRTGSASTQNRYASAVVTYSQLVASSVATPTFSVEAGTYGTKQSVELACESEGAAIYYTLDGTTPTNASTLYESAIELNTKTTVKAIAYVGEDASNVATATYDFKLEGSISFVTASIVANTSMAKIEWSSDDFASNTVNYCITYDGSTPSMENYSTSTAPGKAKTVNLPLYTWKKDTVVTLSVRPELDGIYGDTFTKTFYVNYASSLTAYKATTTMTAGNYAIMGENSVMLPIDAGTKGYGYGYVADATVSNGIVAAFGLFEFTFETADGGYYLKDSKGQYLYAAGYTSFQVGTTPGADYVWTVDIQANGQAKITHVGTGRYMQWDSYYKNWTLKSSDEGTFMPTLAAAFVPEATVSIKNGDVVESLDKITFYCADGIVAAKNITYVAVMTSNATISGTANQIDDNTIELVFSEPITESGSYDLRLYQKAFTLAPNSLAKAWPDKTQTITFTVEAATAPVELVVTPENNSTSKSLQDFTFTCEQGIYVNNFYAGEAPFLGYTDPATGASTQIALTPGMATETMVTLSTAEAQTADGYYTLVVPAEYFVLAESQYNEAIMNQYMVSAINPNAINFVGVTPAEGTVESLKYIQIITDTDLYEAIGLTLTDANGTEYEISAVANNREGDDDIYESIIVTVSEEITAVGTYTLTIPAGAVIEYDGTKTNDETKTYTWTIGSTEPEPEVIVFESVNPAEGTVESLKYIQIITDTDLYKAIGLTLTDANGTEYEVSAVTNNREGDDDIYESIIVTVSEEITAAGTYTLTIPAGAVIEYGGTKTNAEQTYTWTIEGGAVEETDLFFNAEELEAATYDTDVVNGIFTFLCNGKTWQADDNPAYFSNNPEKAYTRRMKAKSGKNTISIAIPEAGKLIFGARTGSNDATDRTLVVTQNETEIYNKVVQEADTLAGKIYLVHEVAVEAGTAVVTMPTGNLNFYFIEFVAGGNEETGITATWSIEEGATIETFESVTITFAGEGIESAKAKATYTNFIFYEKDAEGNYNLVENGGASAGYMDTEATGTTVKFYLDLYNYSNGVDPFYRKGDYRIVLPAGSIKFNDDAENLNTEEYVLNFTIDNDIVELEEIDAVFTATPENNATVTEIREVVVTFPEYEAITVNEMDMVMGSNIPMIYMLDDLTGSMMPAGYIMFRAGDAANQLVLYVDPMYMGVESIAIEGTYRINVPANVVTFSNGINKAFELNYTVKAGEVEEGLYATGSTPANGETVSELTEVIIDWSMGIDNNYSYVGTESPTVYNEAGEEVVDYLVESWKDLDANQIRFILSPAITTPGTYTLKVPAEYFTDNTTYTELSKAAEFTFTVTGEVKEGLYVTKSTPADGATVEELSEFIVEWSMDVDWENGSDFDLTDADGNTYEIKKSINAADGTFLGDNKTRFYLTTPITAAGSYTLRLGEGLCADLASYSIMSEATNITVTVEPAVVSEPLTVTGTDPENGATVEEISDIIVTFSTDIWTGSATPYLADAEGTEVTKFEVVYVDANFEMLPWNQARLLLEEPYKVNGTYTVVIPEGAFVDFEDESNGNVEYTFTLTINFIDAIKGIAVDPVNGYVVYDLNGYRVMQTRNAADLERLNNGIYIINGVKVLLNK